MRPSKEPEKSCVPNVPLRAKLRDIGGIFVKSVSAWVDHSASSLGAALAFYTLFSVAPILIIALSLAGYFFGPHTAETELLVQLRDLTGDAGAEAVRGVLASAQYSDKKGMAAVVGVVTLIIGATSVFGELQHALDVIWSSTSQARCRLVGNGAAALAIIRNGPRCRLLAAGIAHRERRARGLRRLDAGTPARTCRHVADSGRDSEFRDDRALVRDDLQIHAARDDRVARRMDRRRGHGVSVHLRQIADRVLSRQKLLQRRLRRSRLARRAAHVGVLLGADFSAWVPSSRGRSRTRAARTYRHWER